MIGNRVRVIRKDSNQGFVGILIRKDVTGVIVHQPSRTADYDMKLFIPMGEIVEIQDLGRAP